MDWATCAHRIVHIQFVLVLLNILVLQKYYITVNCLFIIHLGEFQSSHESLLMFWMNLIQQYEIINNMYYKK